MGRLIPPCRNKKVTIMNDKLQKNLKGTYITETREMAENAAKKNPEHKFIRLAE